MTSLTLLNSQPIAPATGGAQSVAFSPNGKLLAAANTVANSGGALAPNLNGRVSLFPVVQSGNPPRWQLEPPSQLPTGASGVGYPGGMAFSKADLLATANCVDGSLSLFTNLGHPSVWGPVPGSPFSIQTVLNADKDHPSPGWVDPNALAFALKESISGGAVTSLVATANSTKTVSLFYASSSNGLKAAGVPVSANISPITGEGPTGVAFSHPLGLPWAIGLTLLASANGETSPEGSVSLFALDLRWSCSRTRRSRLALDLRCRWPSAQETILFCSQSLLTLVAWRFLPLRIQLRLTARSG
jgi:hypothetical protein